MTSEALPLTVTDSAVRRIRVLQQKESKPEAALRLRIIAGGCSGMQYRMDLAEAPRPTDMIVAQRDYTANSKVVQTASDLLDVLMNLKR